jgi:hypothetical protein
MLSMGFITGAALGRRWCLHLDKMHLARLLGLVRVHEVLWGPTLPGEVSLGATVEAILGPSLPLTRLMVLGQVGGVVSLLFLSCLAY